MKRQAERRDENLRGAAGIRSFGEKELKGVARRGRGVLFVSSLVQVEGGDGGGRSDLRILLPQNVSPWNKKGPYRTTTSTGGISWEGEDSRAGQGDRTKELTAREGAEKLTMRRRVLRSSRKFARAWVRGGGESRMCKQDVAVSGEETDQGVRRGEKRAP